MSLRVSLASIALIPLSAGIITGLLVRKLALDVERSIEDSSDHLHHNSASEMTPLPKKCWLRLKRCWRS